MIMSAVKINALNAKAQELYAIAAAECYNQTGSLQTAQVAMKNAAIQAGLLFVSQSANDSSDTIIYTDPTTGEIVNCWMSAPQEDFYQDRFDGLGFDENTEWYQG